jgi:hypothetical protein
MMFDEFAMLAAKMKAVYTSATFLPDKFALETWFHYLEDLPKDQCEAAVERYMTTNKFPPTIADIRSMAVENATADTTMTALEAWARVRKAIRNGYYGAEEEWAKLPESCRQVLGSPSNLRAMAQLDSKQVETVEQSHFIRAYDANILRRKDEAKIPESVMRLIGSIKQEALEAHEGKALPGGGT